MAAATTAGNVAADVGRKSEEAGVRLVRGAREAASRSLEARRNQAETYLVDAGRAIEAAADQLVRDNHQLSAHYLRAVARHSRDIATWVDPGDVRAMVGRAEEFLRERPVVSTVAALTLGFAAMQALRAVPETERAPRRRGGASR
jgi:hypothetical protein